ncbi:MAG: lipopolysaccharide biosynthesis protein RfbH [Deltaproteobacteria bacterium]|nr:lipopolysaccharide biosynthesis protein RfbH [Deltaproteobacteria bacterium]
MGKAKLDRVLREVAALMVRSHYLAAHQGGDFVPGKSRLPVAGRVYDDRELINLLNAGLDFWLTSGRYSEAFEKAFTSFLGVEYCFLTNSGSSANLLAFMALTSPRLGERRIRKGDEVITVAAAFPTTVAPIIQYGAIPVFVDIRLPTYNIDCIRLEQALSDRTRAVMLAHTLGNPFDVDRVLSFCRKHGLWLIEDCCDALGSAYAPSPFPGEANATRHSSMVGTFGHISTFSFYPAHHITMGEGGAACTSDPDLKGIVQSLRDWGRDCWCPPGRDNTCGKRFSRQSGELPYGYDHKYVYSHLGYNLKITEMQAAIGCAQIEKLPGFIEARKRNWTLLREGLADLTSVLILPEPTAGADPSWFGFPLTVREGSTVHRETVVARLESRGIQTRTLFSGNIIRHPCFDEMRATGEGYRIAGPLSETDRVTNDSFWVGVYPGLTPERINYMVEEIHKGVAQLTR